MLKMQIDCKAKLVCITLCYNFAMRHKDVRLSAIISQETSMRLTSNIH